MELISLSVLEEPLSNLSNTEWSSVRNVLLKTDGGSRSNVQLYLCSVLILNQY